MKTKRADHAVYKNNFWNQLRKDRNVTFKYIGDILGRSSTMIRYYFMGYQMPNAEQIKLLCDGFNVDIEQGTEEFKKMYKEWHDAHPKTSDIPNKSVTPVTKKPHRRSRAEIDSNNFWRQRVAESKLSFKDLADIIEVPYSTVRGYFCGFVFPPKNSLERICSLFDVPLDVGVAEFEKLNNEWGAKHPDYMKSGNTFKRIVDSGKKSKKSSKKPAKQIKNTESVPTHSLTIVPTNTSDSLKLLNAIAEAIPPMELLELVYGNVPCATFIKIYNIMEKQL